MMKRLLYLTGASVFAIAGLNQPVQAATITFDQTITAGANATVDSWPGFIDQYRPPSQFPPPTPPPNPDAFQTQGFTFGGYTLPVTAGRTNPELVIMLDSSACLATVGTTCADDDSLYLAAGDPFSMFIGGGVNFSLTSFDASGFFPPEGCPQYIENPENPAGPPLQLGCDDEQIIYPALFLKVVGVNSTNGLLATQTSPLTFGFASIALIDPAWGNIAKAIFLPVDAQGNVATNRLLALDNINATAVAPAAVPEPASLLLVATGLAGARRWRRRRPA